MRSPSTSWLLLSALTAVGAQAIACRARTPGLAEGALDAAEPSRGDAARAEPLDGSLPPAPVKILLLAGAPSHGPGEHEYYAGLWIISNLLRQTPGIEPVLIRNFWPEDVTAFDGARAIVMFASGGDTGHPLLADRHLDFLEPKLVGQDVGLVLIHWAVHFPRDARPRVLPLFGGYYETDFSVNPVWTAHFAALPDHPIARGVHPFELLDEWYYDMVFAAAGLTPILSAVPPEDTRFTEDARAHPGRAEVTAWAFERGDGGRSFGFTGAHYHQNWGDADFRRIVVNAILWTAHLEIPPDGAPVALDPQDLDKNLDPK